MNRQGLSVEQLESRQMLSASGFSPLDGVGNNVANPLLGTAGTALLRISPQVGDPSLASNPSSRVVSNILNAQMTSATDANHLSNWGYLFGQFLDHDLGLTPGDRTKPLTILTDPNDPVGMGDQAISRSLTNADGQQINVNTSFIDLSQVYGSTKLVSDALRTFKGGLLKTSAGNMLPFNNLDFFTQAQLDALHMANDVRLVTNDKLFAAGDVRANENPELIAVQTLFMRSHNRIAGQLAASHPGLSDGALFQYARRLNIAIAQNIVYSGYLPALLGPTALPGYQGYDPKIDPSLATEFSTIGFRFGHSLLSSEIERTGNNGQTIQPPIPLAQSFFNPTLVSAKSQVDPFTGLTSTDIGPILKGAASENSNAMDLQAIDDIRNVLFGQIGATNNGLDLMARDVERSRDHGIGTYNDVRAAYGLSPVTSFAQITKDTAVQAQLEQVYGTVDAIDPFEGGLAEDHVRGSDMGALFTRILADQFTRLRDGDRFFFRNESFTAEEAGIFYQNRTLGRVITNNTGIYNLQDNVFVFNAPILGRVLFKPVAQTPLRGIPFVTVQLLDEDGAVIETTRTNSAGYYQFQGPTETGSFTVHVVAPRRLAIGNVDVDVTRGGLISGVYLYAKN
jgi:hypothetical protein